MIAVQTDQRSYVRIQGHAGYAPSGSDIVCAAVSVLYETLKMMLQGQALVHETDGLSFLEARNWLARPWKQEYMDFFVTGVQGVADAFPSHVQLMVRRE